MRPFDWAKDDPELRPPPSRPRRYDTMARTLNADIEAGIIKTWPLEDHR